MEHSSIRCKFLVPETFKHSRPIKPHNFGCCCCDNPEAHLLSSVVQVEEVCNRGQVVPYCELCQTAVTVEQMFYGVCCDKHLICHWWCGPCKCSGVDSDQNTTGQVQYGPREWGNRLSSGEMSGGEALRYKIRQMQVCGTGFWYKLLQHVTPLLCELILVCTCN